MDPVPDRDLQGLQEHNSFLSRLSLIDGPLNALQASLFGRAREAGCRVDMSQAAGRTSSIIW
jgi:hypothetical protein